MTDPDHPNPARAIPGPALVGAYDPRLGAALGALMHAAADSRFHVAALVSPCEGEDGPAFGSHIGPEGTAPQPPFGAAFAAVDAGPGQDLRAQVLVPTHGSEDDYWARWYEAWDDNDAANDGRPRLRVEARLALAREASTRRGGLPRLASELSIPVFYYGDPAAAAAEEANVAGLVLVRLLDELLRT